MNHHADAGRHRAKIRERKNRFTGLILTGFLIGCGTDPALEPVATETQASKTVAEQTASAPAAPAAAPAKPDGPPIVSLPPVQLLGMSQDDIIRNLGQPTFQRRDRTALLLRYREGGCILDLFLYPHDPSGLGKAVDYIEARAPDGQKIETKPCIDAIRKANAAG
ncbi:MAG: hypothetical protein O3C49_07750 [Proteobacteria bacterium]|nr:hypothetical protein [Pseudomonadota bacterium]MDA1323919.1 hypothetical protein [Pseudomonadota bacterium]